MARCLVTGGTGFIGSHVARALVERGDDVCVTVRSRSHLEALAELEVERVSIPDITDRRALRRALRGVERLFHAAGTTDLRLGRDEIMRINAQGTRVVLEG